MTLTVPPPRVPPVVELGGAARGEPWDGWAGWYERELGWATAGGAPVRLLTGLRFDALVVPAVAGHAALRRVGPTGPVALMGLRMSLLVAPGSAEELPGLLDWLEWGGVALSLTGLGAGGRITAPPPPGRPAEPGAASWLRPPGRHGNRTKRRFSRLSPASGAGMPMLPTSSGSWTPWRRNATGRDWRVPGRACSTMSP